MSNYDWMTQKERQYWIEECRRIREEYNLDDTPPSRIAREFLIIMGVLAVAAVAIFWFGVPWSVNAVDRLIQR